jgi:hypothetical protein
MKYYTSSTEYNCGIDLHARQMYVCVIWAAAWETIPARGCSRLNREWVRRTYFERVSVGGTSIENFDSKCRRIDLPGERREA